MIYKLWNHKDTKAQSNLSICSVLLSAPSCLRGEMGESE